MIKAGIIGGSGYTGGELIRLLLNHPEVAIDFVYSSTKPGKPISQAHPDLYGLQDLKFSGEINSEIDVLFLCLGHGHSREFLSANTFHESTKFIDLSTDFRSEAQSDFGQRNFVYGLTELNGDKIRKADNIANPGCFATAIQLALLPMAKANMLNQSVHINGTTGSTGAGIMPSATTHFSWRNNNISWYKPFTHQHMNEVNESLHSFQSPPGKLYFLPHRGNFSRGILITAYTEYSGTQEEAEEQFREFYSAAPFTQLVDQPIQLKQVVNTNQCHIHLHKHDDILLITSAIDNLLKGASGQAVENLNLMFGLKQETGLRLKAGAF